MATNDTTVTASTATSDARTRAAAAAAAAAAAPPPSGSDGDEMLPDADSAPPQDAPNAAATTTSTVTTASAEDGRSEKEPPPPPPPGPRAARLQDLFASSLHHTLAKVSWDNFAACYPTAARRNPAALQAVHRAMLDRLRELCAAEFAAVMRSRDVVRRLNELEELVEGAARRRGEHATESGQSGQSGLPAPPHTLPAPTMVAAHLARLRPAQTADLEARLRAVQTANAARFARLAAQQAEAAQLVAALERALADAEGAARLLEEGPGTHGGSGGGGNGSLVAELAREARAAEVEMAGI